ncbi:hypothetical protein L195_g019863 [Trifolium pratense]|uniref:Uncharacterized protein n=1 Tax=Trifolium pratense TaxID=57577 RepID=A0A2K3N0V4_TRIPR|nr:hypothetical protein L195_g019863 [Trifolium pratense]
MIQSEYKQIGKIRYRSMLFITYPIQHPINGLPNPCPICPFVGEWRRSSGCPGGASGPQMNYGNAHVDPEPAPSTLTQLEPSLLPLAPPMALLPPMAQPPKSQAQAQPPFLYYKRWWPILHGYTIKIHRFEQMCTILSILGFVLH